MIVGILIGVMAVFTVCVIYQAGKMRGAEEVRNEIEAAMNDAAAQAQAENYAANVAERAFRQ